MSRGPEEPVISIPTRCTTLELKDLADTEDFDQNGEVGALYAMVYTDEGLYKRREIEDKKNPKLEHLRNVEVDIAEDYEYRIFRENKTWHLKPYIDWEIKFEFISPFTFFDSKKNFRKALNCGPLHVSLVPENNSRREIEIRPFKKRNFLLHRKDSVTKDSNTYLQFVPKMTLPNEFTMIFDISILNVDSARLASGVTDTLMKGITVAWLNLDVEALRITIAIQNNEDGAKAIASSDKINLNVNPKELKELDTINVTHLDLIGFYYTDKVLPEKVLKNIVEFD